MLAFAGKRWRVEAVDQGARIILVAAHRSGKVPQFEAVANEQLDDRLVGEMKRVLSESGVPAYLDVTGKSLMEMARREFLKSDIGSCRYYTNKRNVHIFTWKGTTLNMLLALLLKARGLAVNTHPLGVTVAETSEMQVKEVINVISVSAFDMDEIAQQVELLPVGKWDGYVPEGVLLNQWKRTYSAFMTPLRNLVIELDEI